MHWRVRRHRLLRRKVRGLSARRHHRPAPASIMYTVSTVAMPSVAITSGRDGSASACRRRSSTSTPTAIHNDIVSTIAITHARVLSRPAQTAGCIGSWKQTCHYTSCLSDNMAPIQLTNFHHLLSVQKTLSMLSIAYDAMPSNAVRLLLDDHSTS